jgi:ATP-dependent Clp protease adaptor protein ClpS
MSAWAAATVGMAPTRRDKPEVERDTDVATETRTKKQTKKPPLYKVILHNDDFTPMEFVVDVLIKVFQKSESDAMAIMLHAHTRGYAVAGVYVHEIAEAKVKETLALARERQFPLLATLEPD